MEEDPKFSGPTLHKIFMLFIVRIDRDDIHIRYDLICIISSGIYLYLVAVDIFLFHDRFPCHYYIRKRKPSGFLLSFFVVLGFFGSELYPVRHDLERIYSVAVVVVVAS